ncbi:hypothetical protein HDV06_002706 [Boothiomyces sp. JEL0866]|nr:hypothetical protein HDV06_002706 [Boothiomyces sp. JEL0866]
MAGFAQAYGLLTLFKIGLLYLAFNYHKIEDSAADLANQISTSSLVTSDQLLYFRIFCLISNLYVDLIPTLFDKVGHTITAFQIDTQPRTIRMAGGIRFCTFTLWSWLIQGIYFGLAIATQLGYVKNLHLLEAIVIMFELATSVAILVTVVVTFVLIPEAAKGDVKNMVGLFRFQVLLTHNANVVFMITELVLNNIKFKFSHFPYAGLFGITYIAFSWLLAQKIGVFFYNFLNYNFPKVLVAYTGLLFALSVFFTISFGISHYIDPRHNPWTIPFIIAGVISICKVRMPATVKPKKE